jgi:hypothetical protein
MTDNIINTMNELPKLPLHLSKDWIANSYMKFGTNLNYDFQGPTRESNWLIKNRLLVGGYVDSIQTLNSIKEQGITKFVCLNAEYGTNTGKRTFMPYGLHLAPGDFLNFPLKDMSDHESDEELYQICVIVANLIKDNHNVYLHCSGGHGRTGMVSMIVLYLLYKKQLVELFDYVQYAHDQRVGHRFEYRVAAHHIVESDLRRLFIYGQVPSPQLSSQRHQVGRIIKQLQTKRLVLRRPDNCVEGASVANNAFAEDVAFIGAVSTIYI